MSGAAGSNECPAGSVRIEAEAACRTAAAAAGKTVGRLCVGCLSTFLKNLPASPRGCYYEGNNAYLNAHAVGTGNADTQLLCAAAVTTGAPFSDERSCRPARAAAPGLCYLWDAADSAPQYVARQEYGLCGMALSGIPRY